MKRLIILMGFFTLLALTACGGGNRAKAQEESEEDETMATQEKTGWDNLPDEPVFDIVTTMGTIRVKLYADTPRHKNNFVKLVKQGFYDGLLFHRVVKDFVIQTGDQFSRDPSLADKWGTGGFGDPIPAEILPQYYHKKGALAAARRGNAANPNRASNGSQFYIVQDEMNCLHLDGEYTIFGETIDGFDVIDEISEVPTDSYDRPLMNVKILKIELVDLSEVENEVNEVENKGEEVEEAGDDVEKGENDVDNEGNGVEKMQNEVDNEGNGVEKVADGAENGANDSEKVTDDVEKEGSEAESEENEKNLQEISSEEESGTDIAKDSDE